MGLAGHCAVMNRTLSRSTWILFGATRDTRGKQRVVHGQVRLASGSSSWKGLLRCYDYHGLECNPGRKSSMYLREAKRKGPEAARSPGWIMMLWCEERCLNPASFLCTI